MLRFIVACLAIANRDCIWVRETCVPRTICLRGSGFEACDHVFDKCWALKTAEACVAA